TLGCWQEEEESGIFVPHVVKLASKLTYPTSIDSVRANWILDDQKSCSRIKKKFKNRSRKNRRKVRRNVRLCEQCLLQEGAFTINESSALHPTPSPNQNDENSITPPQENPPIIEQEPRVCTNPCIHVGGTPLASNEDPLSPSVRIINGTRCAVGKSPVVQVFGGPYSCSGVIISPFSVLTAAHCIKWPTFTVIAGGYTENPIRASSFVAHPEFSTEVNFQIEHPDPAMNDIAILRFSSPLSIPPAEVEFQYDLKDQEEAVIAGYGKRDEFESHPAGELSSGCVLIDNDVEEEDFHDLDCVLTGSSLNCDDTNSREIIFNYEADGSLQSPTNTCKGDSGGPLMVFHDNKWKVAGTSSTSDTPGGSSLQCGPNQIVHYSNLSEPSNRDFICTHAPEVRGCNSTLP
ncbi:MAG: trypsin-like serine protease, partial [Bdellovibrionales bacterium]|nr:trypsin-like serine protease [Bdellovibrionales bacterium]